MRARRRKGRRRITLMLFSTVASLTVLAASLAYYLSIPQDLSSSSNREGGTGASRAVIVDGIGLTKPNPAFLEGVRETLIQAGLNVDVYSGSQVTMKLLDSIQGYSLIVLRVHSAVDAKYRFLYLFSTEAYNSERYLLEQLYGAYREAYTFDRSEGPYFALRADLLGDEDGLKGSTIILMGCNGTNSNHAIERLFERGVESIIAWDGYVSLEYTDEATLTLLKLVYIEGLSYGDAVQRVMESMGSDPTWGSRLIYLANPEI
ncbi:MAG: hypothetical protein QXQ29_05485 [Candidatus Bathyarchaeia archaeon]